MPTRYSATISSIEKFAKRKYTLISTTLSKTNNETNGCNGLEFCRIVLLYAAAIVAVLYLFDQFTGPGILKNFVLSKPVIGALAAAIKSISDVWPNDTLDKVYCILRAGAEGAEIAEDLWLMGELQKDERNAFAKQLAKDTLGASGIEVTPQIEVIISGMIEAVCILLPHGIKPSNE